MIDKIALPDVGAGAISVSDGYGWKDVTGIRCWRAGELYVIKDGRTYLLVKKPKKYNWLKTNAEALVVFNEVAHAFRRFADTGEAEHLKLSTQWVLWSKIAQLPFDMDAVEAEFMFSEEAGQEVFTRITDDLGSMGVHERLMAVRFCKLKDGYEW